MSFDMFYTCAIILAELMMLAMALHVVRYPGFGKRQKTWYLCTFIAIMVCAGSEFAVHCGYYDPSFAPLLTVLTVLQFSIAPLLAVLFSGSLGLEKQFRNAIVFSSVSFLVQTVSAPFGWIFYFDQEGYHRGDLFIIYEVLFIFSLLYLIVCLVLVGRKFSHRDRRTIWMVIVILVAGIVPMAILKINITYVAIAIAASICYIYYNDLVQQDIQKELVQNQNTISNMQSHIISSLASLIESRDLETGSHVTRTSDFVETLAKHAAADGVYPDQLDERFIFKMKLLAPMHDIGKIVISDTILQKPGKLTPEEFEQMKTHAAAGGAIIKNVLEGVTDEEYQSFASDIAMFHHERWDGTGYPNGLSGENIPLPARIMAIADVYDALISKRCYKEAVSIEDAVAIIRDESESHFDPNLVEVFLRHREDFTKTRISQIAAGKEVPSP